MSVMWNLINDVFGEAVNIAARLETVAEAGELAVSLSTVLSMEPTLANKFRCGKHSLKYFCCNRYMEYWENKPKLKGLSDRDNTRKYISIVPFSNPGGSVSEFTDELIENLAVD